MSQLSIKELLSHDVALIKERLGIESYTWGEHSDKLNEVFAQNDTALQNFISDGNNAVYVASAVKDITTIRGNAFGYCTQLTTADFPEVINIGTYAFNSCTNLASVNFPAATVIGSNAFAFCNKLTSVKFPSVTTINNAAFMSCSKLAKADFPKVVDIQGQAFYVCKKLEAVILRNEETVCTLANKSAFDLANNAYIYVPSALVEDYKAATNWSNYAERIRAIEDYPDIAGETE